MEWGFAGNSYPTDSYTRLCGGPHDSRGYDGISTLACQAISDHRLGVQYSVPYRIAIDSYFVPAGENADHLMHHILTERLSPRPAEQHPVEHERLLLLDREPADYFFDSHRGEQIYHDPRLRRIPVLRMPVAMLDAGAVADRPGVIARPARPVFELLDFVHRATIPSVLVWRNR